MAGSVNKVILVGHLGKDPEIRYTQQSVPIATLSVATSETWKDRNSGEKKEKTEWHRVIVWGAHDNPGLAGVAEKFLRKGSKVYIEGELQTKKWQDQSGQERYTTEVVVKGFRAQLVLLDRNEGSGNRPPPEDGSSYTPSRERPSANRPSAAPAFQGADMADDIPF